MPLGFSTYSSALAHTALVCNEAQQVELPDAWHKQEKLELHSKWCCRRTLIRVQVRLTYVGWSLKSGNQPGSCAANAHSREQKPRHMHSPVSKQLGLRCSGSPQVV